MFHNDIRSNVCEHAFLECSPTCRNNRECAIMTMILEPLEYAQAVCTCVVAKRKAKMQNMCEKCILYGMRIWTYLLPR